MENLDRRSPKVVLESFKNGHRGVRVNHFPSAEVWVRGINNALRFAPGEHGNLIIQSLHTLEISLREVWKNLVLNIFLVQRDDNPVHTAEIGALRIRKGGCFTGDRTDQSR